MPNYKPCEETTGMIGNLYTRCGRPAKKLIQHRGRSEGPYWMCDECAWHNCRNRNAEDITPAGVVPATLMIHAKPGLWTPGIFALWAEHAEPRFKPGESCSSANYFEPRAARDEYDHARDYYGFVYTVQPGNRVCYVHFSLDGAPNAQEPDRHKPTPAPAVGRSPSEG